MNLCDDGLLYIQIATLTLCFTSSLSKWIIIYEAAFKNLTDVSDIQISFFLSSPLKSLPGSKPPQDYSKYWIVLDMDLVFQIWNRGRSLAYPFLYQCLCGIPMLRISIHGFRIVNLAYPSPRTFSCDVFVPGSFRLRWVITSSTSVLLRITSFLYCYTN